MRHLGILNPNVKCPPNCLAYGSVIGTVCLILFIVVIVVVTSTCPNQPKIGPLIRTTQEPILSNYSVLCYIQFNTSHVGFSPNQSPHSWTSLFIPYSDFPNSRDTIQITPYNQKGEVSQGGLKSKVIQAFAAYGVMFVNLEYWGETPWRLYVATRVLEIKPNMKEYGCEYYDSKHSFIT